MPILNEGGAILVAEKGSNIALLMMIRGSYQD